MRLRNGVFTPLDVLLALALTLASQVEIWAPALVPGSDEVDGSRPLLAFSTLLMTAPLAVRRAAPLAVVVLVLGAAAVQQLVTVPTEGLSTLIACLVASYSASAYAAGRRAAAGGIIVALASTLIGRDLADHVFVAVVLGSAWVTGLVVGWRSDEVARLRDDNQDLHARLAAAATALAAASERPGGEAAYAGPEGLTALTRRELDVARAIAAGMSNAEIAEHLVISEWTVKTHVASILRKLSLRDRAQVVVAAYESGLVQPGQDPRS